MTSRSRLAKDDSQLLLLNPYVMWTLAVIGCAAGSLLVPYIWASDLYVDGYRIANSPPRLALFGSSFEAAALLLWPWLELANLANGRVIAYGQSPSVVLYVANFVFGTTYLFGILALVSLRRIAIRSLPMAGTLLLMTPFMFNITKELVLFVVSTWAIWLGRNASTHFRALGVLLSGSVVLGLFFRSYYLLFAVVLLVAVTTWRRNMRIPAYLSLVVLCVLFYEHVPTEDVTVGRAYYLESVSQTRITYVLPDTDGVAFVLNRLVTIAELLLPVRLVVLSPVYAPYVVLQIILTWRTLKALSADQPLVKLAGHVVLSFTITQAVFEPDFGSYFRHKLSILPFMLIVLSVTAGHFRGSAVALGKHAPGTGAARG